MKRFRPLSPADETVYVPSPVLRWGNPPLANGTEPIEHNSYFDLATVNLMRRSPVPTKIRNFLLVASKHQCSICQSNTVDVHHIIAVANGGTNDLDNLMTVCPNHHRDYHSGKFTIEQMRMHRTQWLQRCRVFLEIGIPTEKITKDKETASKLPLEYKIQSLIYRMLWSGMLSII